MRIKKDGTLDMRYKQVEVTKSSELKSHYRICDDIIYFKNGSTRETKLYLQKLGSHISCGVYEWNCVNRVGKFLRDVSWVSDKLMEDALRNYFKKYKGKICAFFIASNFVQANSERVNAIMDKIATHISRERKNPNSGRMIKIWIV